jgi:hypothetical protein
MVVNLKEIFETQVKQQSNWYDVERLTLDEKSALTKELALGLHEEISELVRRVDTGRYHILQGKSKPEPGQVAYDAAEALKMLVALVALHGVDGQMMGEYFERVTRVVDDKWRGQNLKLSTEVNVLLCDLDGCVADWVTAFKAFALARGIDIPPNGFNDPSLEPLKDEFDRSGGYLTIPPMPGAVEALKTLKNFGVKLVVVTARPYHRFRRVYADTLEWCEKNGIEYDHIMFFRDKAEAVRRVAPTNILGFVEDRAKHAIEVALTGVKVLKMPCETIEAVSHENITEVTGWDEILSAILERHTMSAKFDTKKGCNKHDTCPPGTGEDCCHAEHCDVCATNGSGAV